MTTATVAVPVGPTIGPSTYVAYNANSVTSTDPTVWTNSVGPVYLQQSVRYHVTGLIVCQQSAAGDNSPPRVQLVSNASGFGTTCAIITEHIMSQTDDELLVLGNGIQTRFTSGSASLTGANTGTTDPHVFTFDFAMINNGTAYTVTLQFQPTATTQGWQQLSGGAYLAVEQIIAPPNPV